MSSSVPTEICLLCLKTEKIIPTHLFPTFDKPPPLQRKCSHNKHNNSTVCPWRGIWKGEIKDSDAWNTSTKMLTETKPKAWASPGDPGTARGVDMGHPAVKEELVPCDLLPGDVITGRKEICKRHICTHVHTLTQ